MLATFAFDVCHDVYRGAREMLDAKIATLSLENCGKYQWHPDRTPGLAEYVADFARAGERALGERRDGSGRASRNGRGAARASRLILFRVFYLGGAEFHAARRHLGISELTWADWAEEIRGRVGQELLRSGIFPPSQYFQVMTRAAETRQREQGAA